MQHFIADLHLSESRPETERAFLAYLNGEGRQATRLYILGDLFERWIGDDDDDPLPARVAAALHALAESGTQIFFLHGNRDFLLGEHYAESAGMTLLSDPWRACSQGQALLLTHGDLLCTRDTNYQQVRVQMRQPDWRSAFLAQPLSERRALAERYRARSEAATGSADPSTLDAAPETIDAWLRAHDYPTLIHGHTHRPNHHRHELDGHACVRHVLADWHDTARWLALPD